MFALSKSTLTPVFFCCSLTATVKQIQPCYLDGRKVTAGPILLQAQSCKFVCAFSLREGEESLGNFNWWSLCSPVMPTLWADLDLYGVYHAVIWTLGELHLLLLCGLLAWQQQQHFGLGEADLQKVLGITVECCNARSWQPPQPADLCLS